MLSVLAVERKPYCDSRNRYCDACADRIRYTAHFALVRVQTNDNFRCTVAVCYQCAKLSQPQLRNQILNRQLELSKIFPKNLTELQCRLTKP